MSLGTSEGSLRDREVREREAREKEVRGKGPVSRGGIRQGVARGIQKRPGNNSKIWQQQGQVSPSFMPDHQFPSVSFSLESFQRTLIRHMSSDKAPRALRRLRPFNRRGARKFPHQACGGAR